MPTARKNGIFDAFTEKKVTYRRTARPKAAGADKEMRDWQINLQKEWAFERGQDDRKRFASPRPVSIATLESAKKILGAQKAAMLAKQHYMAGWRTNPAKTRLDLALDRVKAGKHEVTIHVDGYTQAQKDEVIRRAEARGFHASSDGKRILVRDLRGNPSNAELDREVAVAEISESWHGRKPKIATDYIERLKYHDKLADLAQLIELNVRVLGEGKPQWIRFDRKTKVGYTRAGGRQQLHVEGGDQSLDLRKLGLPKDEADKDLVFVGFCSSIVYRAEKLHLNEREPVQWEHKFGEEGGSEPVLIYDALNERILLAGGTYDIKLRDYDGKHSRGIVN